MTLPLPGTATLQLPGWARGFVDPARDYPSDEDKVALAIELSRGNVVHATGGPFGAAIFDGDDRIVSIGVNVVLPQRSSIAHAEMLAFLLAQQHLGRARLNENGGRYVLATSSQPCCQCYGASVWAGIDRLLIGARAEDVMRLTDFDEGPLPADWIGELEARGIEVRRDVKREAASGVLADYARLGGARY
jgi:tRNA(Arg) A34 adenosine deaminase TadA